MNFLSHYYFYKSNNSYFNTGLILPDMVKTFCKIHLKPGEKYTNRNLQALRDGSMTHIESDKLFHSSFFFKNTTEFLSANLDLESHWPRKWFMNHLLTEILLDRVLMDRDNHLCAEFYDQLEQTNSEQIELFLKLTGIHNPQNFSVGFSGFVKHRFIFDYYHNEKIIMALNRVYKRVGILYEWTEMDKSLLLGQLPKILIFIEKNLNALEQELKLK